MLRLIERGCVMEQLQIGDIKVTWLKGGNTHLDGGQCLVLCRKYFGHVNINIMTQIIFTYERSVTFANERRKYAH